MKRRKVIKRMALGMIMPKIIFASGIQNDTLKQSPDEVSGHENEGDQDEGDQNEGDQNEKIWFRYPARYWNSQALHIGNGFMGLSFWGTIGEERFDLTEKSMWKGGPGATAAYHYGIKTEGRDYLAEIRRLITTNDIENLKKADQLVKDHFLDNRGGFGAFSSLGQVFLKFDHSPESCSNYVRMLDLSQAVGHVSYNLDGINYQREYFCSYPDRVAVMRISSNRKNKISFRTRVDIIQKDHKIMVDNDLLHLSGKINGNGRRFSLKMKILRDGGNISSDNDSLVVSNADSVIILLALSTEYSPLPPLFNGVNPDALSSEQINLAAKKSFSQLKSTHIKDYQHLYSRVTLQVAGDTGAELLPTDQRWKNYKNEGKADPGLTVIYFNLGRYLLISSSRPGSLPAGLQGVWNVFEDAPWTGNYQSNINFQMIYSSGYLVNLYECQLPYIEWVKGIVAPGREMARTQYGTKGWVSNAVGNIWGYVGAGEGLSWGLYPIAPAWHCRILWEYFKFSQNKQYLKDVAYPIMKEAAEFWIENLIPYNGVLINAPSVAAEHGARIEEGKLFSESGRVDVYNIPGNYQDMEMIYDLFSNVSEAAEVLNTDKDFVRSINTIKSKLPPLKVGRYGQLQEWIEDIDSRDCNHRHISHLYAVWPGYQISPYKDLAMVDAAKRVLNMRGDGICINCGWEKDVAAGGNWSRALRLWCWVRLHDAERANKIFTELITEEGFENLLTFQHVFRRDSSPLPKSQKDQEVRSNMILNWQVDASIAIPGMIAEMLLQTFEDTLYLLPALPKELDTGNIKGLKAPGDFEVDMEWKEGKVVNYSITSSTQKTVKVKVNGEVRQISITKAPLLQNG